MRSVLVAAGALVTIAGLSTGAWAQSAKMSKMALMTCEAQIEIKATPAQVWKALTDADKVQSWCPLWKAAAQVKPLTSVGQTIAFKDDWGNVGKSVVIFVDAGKELRVAHVPDNGSYLCQTRFVIAPGAQGTVVHVTEQYSDAMDVPTDADTATQTQKSMEDTLASLKKIAEAAKSAKAM
jgi:uncharacterized protein YndB with AHSA1/START domain